MHRTKDQIMDELKAVKEELRVSEARYRSLADNISVGVAIISPEMEILALNRQMHAWFPGIDVAKKPLCHRSFNDPPQEAVCPYCPTHRTLKDKEVHHAISDTPRGGEIRHYHIISSPLLDNNGNVKAAMELVEDVSEKKKLSERLKKGKEVFFSVLRKAPYGVVLIDQKGDYLFVNEEFTNITGYTLYDTPKGSVWFRKAYPNKRYRREAMRSWKGDISRKGATQVFAVTCRDGKRKDIEFRPTLLEEGVYIVMLSDITQRKKAEKELQRARDELGVRVAERTAELIDANRALQEEIAERKQIENSLRDREAQLREIVEATELQIYVCSEDYRIEFMNEKLIERTGYDGTGMLCYKVLHERGSVCPWCENEQVFGGVTVHREIQSQKDGHWYYVVNTPVTNPDNTMSKYAMLLDITERKTIEEEVRRLNYELRQRVKELGSVNSELEAFCYSISHDLGTPLTAIEGFSNMLLRRHSQNLGKKGKDLLRVISASTKQMRELINDLLAFSRLGRQKIRSSNTNMKKLVDEICGQFMVIHGKDNLTMVVNDLPPAKCDRAMVGQVFANLIGNAIKYSRPKNRAFIEVGGLQGARDNTYYVKDNGIGFPMEEAKRLFKVFERLHGQDEFEGTGIGLSIAQRVIKRHRGKIWAEGKPGEGATFYFSLPTG